MSFIFGAETEFFLVPYDFATAKSLYFPLGVSAIKLRTPTGGNQGRRQYVVGGHTANILIDEEARCLIQGIPKPLAPPSVAVGVGSTPQICYQRFYDEITQERGPLSAGTTVTGNTTRAWTNIPTSAPNDSIAVEGTATFALGVVTGVKSNYTKLRPGDRIAVSTDLTRWARIRTITADNSMTVDDTGMVGAGVTLVVKAVPRVSHVEQWVSVSGGLPRFASRVRLGTTAITESTATLALGEAETESFDAMPFGSGGVLYNHRQFVWGVEGHEDEVFASKIDFMERWAGLGFKTDYGEKITGGFRHRKYIVILCADTSYILQGLTDEDLVMEPLEPFGGFGPTISAEGTAFVPSRHGMQAFNGAFHKVIPTRRQEWTSEVKGAPLAYERGFLAINPHDRTVQFYPNIALQNITDKATVWVGHYDGVGAQNSGELSAPEWVNDTQTTVDAETVTAAKYLIPSGYLTGFFYRGTSAGKIWEEDESESIALSGFISRVAYRHENFGEPGGKMDEGKTLLRLLSYILAENIQAFRCRVWPGDEYCFPRGLAGIATPTFEDQITTPATTEVSSDTVWVHPEIQKDARGFTVEHWLENPRAVKIMGFGGAWERIGIATHPDKFAVE